MKLADRVAVVTGAGSGIGRSIALSLAREGARVAIVDKDEKSARHTADWLARKKLRSMSIAADVCKSSDVREAARKVIETWGTIDVLVNNAGVPSFNRLTDTSEEEWDRVLDTNLKGAFLWMKYAIPAMMRKKRGAVVNVSSVGGLVGKENRLAYGVSKAGMIFLTKGAALEYARYGVRVNCICPGTIDTPFTANALELAAKKSGLKVSMEKEHPLGRLGKPEEVADLALFLSSDDSAFITGAVIPIDGGRVAGFHSD